MVTLPELNIEFLNAIEAMDLAFNELEKSVPAPQMVTLGNGQYVRYVEKTLQQALLLKAARLISNLRAGCLLVNEGFILEVGGIQRWIDEANDDLVFLMGPLFGFPEEAIHQQYLNDFWQEEFDVPGDAMRSAQVRAMVQRRKIHAYNARCINPSDPSTMKDALETISKAYSGYIHGASVHIIDIYDGSELKFHLAGLKGTDRHQGAVDDFANYVYRSVMTLTMVAIVWPHRELASYLKQQAHRLGKNLDLE